ncbi:sorting nexin-14-like isoform X3 [Oscarella lobularis]|uniref:sorting nexin-14-like isoform X3 n=1 Tax=Oscarella lobularis TaxID=121494 RepID=UPI0033131BA0
MRQRELSAASPRSSHVLPIYSLGMTFSYLCQSKKPFRNFLNWSCGISFRSGIGRSMIMKSSSTNFEAISSSSSPLLSSEQKKSIYRKSWTEKLIQAGMAHLHVIFAVKDKNPCLKGAAFVGAILREYGDDVHEAVRGEHASIRYLRRVAAIIVPRVLPPASLKSRSLVAFLEELTARQLLSRLCQVISSPDIVNKIVIELILPAKPVNR